MSNQEFENYVTLIGKLLQLTREQRDQISGELQDHLQMRVADLTRMRVRALVDETDVLLVAPGQPTRIYLQAEQQKPFAGHVGRHERRR